MAALRAIHRNPVEYDDNNWCWGYWNQDFTVWHGGYDTEQEARSALQIYCMRVLGWDTDA
jgi:hypothetical protein